MFLSCFFRLLVFGSRTWKTISKMTKMLRKICISQVLNVSPSCPKPIENSKFSWLTGKGNRKGSPSPKHEIIESKYILENYG